MRLCKRECYNSNKIEDLFQVYVQPVFDVNKFSIVKAEALIRTRSNIFCIGENNASKAFEIVKKNGWYYELDEYVLNTACEFIKENAHRIDKQISINICKETIELHGVADKLMDTINKHNIDKKMIAFEINEKTDFNSPIAIENMEKLENLGMEIMIDDFGFGDTSLLVIGEYKISTVKLDKVFIQDLSDRRVQIVKEMIGFLDNLGINVIIEGVENKEQLDIIRDLGNCNVQGFLLGKPVDLETYVKLYTN